MIPKKVVKIPDCFFVHSCEVFSKTGDLNRYGEVMKDKVKCRCKFTQKTKRVLNEDKNITTINATAIISGKIELKNIVGNEFYIFEKKYIIYSCKEIRNVDGSIHHYKLELI